jgi:hypothetical protein
MFGLGGIMIEVVKDVTFRVPPFAISEAEKMLVELRGGEILNGVRGQLPADKASLIKTIMAVQQMAVDFGTSAGGIGELDINPLIAGPKAAVAADALVVIR